MIGTSDKMHQQKTAIAERSPSRFASLMLLLVISGGEQLEAPATC